jgi:hypothetical protein
VLSVVTWLWRTTSAKYLGQGFKFSPKHVNMLRAALERHLRVPHELVCFTDDATGLDARIRAEPIWPDPAGYGKCWRRLACFAPSFGALVGPRYLSLDLDCVLASDLTPLVERDDPLVLWRPRGLDHFNGSIWLHTPGTYADILDGYDPQLSPYDMAELGLEGSDQAWLTHKLWGRVPTWGAGDGVYRWRTDCRPEPPKDARIVFFPGRMKPNHPKMCHVAPWLVDHEHGRAWLAPYDRLSAVKTMTKLRRRLAQARVRARSVA